MTRYNVHRSARARRRGAIQTLGVGALLTIFLASTALFRASPSSSNSDFAGRHLLSADKEIACSDLLHDDITDRCDFARSHCETGSMLNYVVLYYCHVESAGKAAQVAMQVAAVLGVILLFRLLSTTAEDFLSPILTQISQEFCFPPRLAGVTLLAWGNGAPDIFSSIAAVKGGQYTLALGGQLGAGMFIGTMVVGAVLWVADGAAMRGALLRDVSCYALSVVAVVAVLASGQVTATTAVILLGSYLLFVLAVFAADLWHIISGSLRSKWSGTVRRHNQNIIEDQWQGMRVPHSPEASSSGPVPDHTEHPNHKRPYWRRASEVDLEQALLSGEQGSEVHVIDPRPGPSQPRAQTPLPLARSSSTTTASELSIELTAPLDAPLRIGTPSSTRESAKLQRPIESELDAAALALHDPLPSRQLLTPESSPGSVSSPLITPTSVTMPQEVHRSRSDSPPYEAAPQRSLPERLKPIRSYGVRRGSAASEVHLSGFSVPLTYHDLVSMSGREYRDEAWAELSGYPAWGWQRPLQEIPPSPTGSKSSGSEGPRQREPTFASISPNNPTLAAVETVMHALEWPFICAQRATIPLLSVDRFERRWFLLSLAAAPPALVLYAGLPLPVAALTAFMSTGLGLIAAAATENTPEEAPVWDCGLPVPVGALAVALVAFVVTCCWINSIASELLGLLQFFGILCHISDMVLGLTVLAWGNSVPDMITDVAMARTSFSNMAMTACFGGPMCNLLTGLGLGFLALLSSSSASVATVELTFVTGINAFILVANCVAIAAVGVLHSKWVPRWYGLVLLCIYVCYIAINFSMIFLVVK